MPFRQLNKDYKPPKIQPKTPVKRITKQINQQHKRMTTQQLKLAESMRAEGRTYRYIAEQIGFSCGAVWLALNKKPRIKVIQEKTEENKELTRLYKSGLSTFAIADKLGMSQRNVWLRLAKHNGVTSLKEIERD